MKNFCGLVSIVGRPNVGKSTLLNKILEQKISITSRKSQTTRNNILGIKTKDNYQMVFIDTPGVHINASKVMNKVLNQSALGAIEDADLIIFMLQRNKINALDELILERLKEVKTKKVCVINKLDQVSSINSLLPVIEKLRTDNDFAEIIPVSAKTGQNINDLENIICENLPENNHLYDTNTKYLAKDSFMVSEIIREKIIRYLGEELPHETYVHLQKLEDKENIINIYAEIIGFGMSADAHHITSPPDAGEGAALSMENAIKDATIDPSLVDYVNAHGTSTPAGDIAETQAIKSVFTDNKKDLIVSSTKSMTGHLLGAAGAVEAIFSILSIKNNICPPTINLENPDIGCDLNYSALISTKKTVNYTLSNSFGFGGTNATLIFKELD